MGAHSWQAEGLDAIRTAKVDAMVSELGSVEALEVLETAALRCLDQAGAYQHKGWNGAARAYVCAAEVLRADMRRLVERHA